MLCGRLGDRLCRAAALSADKRAEHSVSNRGPPMPNAITITVGDIQLEAELNDTAAGQAVFDALPITASGNTWGEEIYFEIPVDEPEAPDATEDVAVGDLGYWPAGQAFCIFFGRTPASTGDEPRAASPVNLIGRVLDDATVLSDSPDGVEVRIEAEE